MTRDWSLYSNLFVQLFADCIPVRGAHQSALYDLTRREIITFPSDYYPVLSTLQGKRIGDLLATKRSEPNGDRIFEFLEFLDDNELILLVADIAEFPPIENEWDFPGRVQNAIIDIDATLHDFRKIFDQLSSLGCQHVQIRSFSNLLSLEECRSILNAAGHKTIVGIELILKHEDGLTDETYVIFVQQNLMVTALTIHSAPQSQFVPVDRLDGEPTGGIRFTSQKIDSKKHCGIISEKYLTLPTVESFFEAKSFNGCMNRKVSIDAHGEIKNCPSMEDSYGNLNDKSLNEALSAPSFQEKWGISKDQIAICKDCEFRYSCSDCRGYLEDPSNIYSKPLKCGYDPYTATWSDWTANPNKTATAKFYGIAVVGEKSGV